MNNSSVFIQQTSRVVPSYTVKIFSNSCFIELILSSATKTDKIFVKVLQHIRQGATLKVGLMRIAYYPFTYVKLGW